MMRPSDIGAGLAIGLHRMPCPECDRGNRDTALAVTVEHDGVVWYCHRCQFTGGRHENSLTYRAGSPRSASKSTAINLTLAESWREFWQKQAPIQGTAGEYLASRGCCRPPSDGDLRCTETLKHPSGHIGPGLIALVTDAATGEALTLHKTWVRADGSKADIDKPRLLLAKHRKKNGVVRLWSNDAVTTGLAIAEGIETALSAALVFTPVWSAIDAGNLGDFPVLGGIESLMIFADHDVAGLRAAEQCAERWYRAGREVRIIKPPTEGADFNDLVRSAA